MGGPRRQRPGVEQRVVLEFSPDAIGLAVGSTPTPASTLPHLWWANPLLRPFVDAGQRAAYTHFSVPAGDRPAWERRFADLDRELHEERAGAADVVAAVFDHIEAHYAGPLSTHDVAAAVGLTPGYLTTVVRERTGRSVLDWITERRMTQARHLLLTTDLTAEQVAGRVGYPDPTYFSRRFRALHGLAPGRWRTLVGGR